MKLTLRLGNKSDVAWAQVTVTAHHYLRQPVDPRARPMVYLVEYEGACLGLAMLGIPHATRCGGWWGYPGLPTQWQVVDLCRVWLDPRIQAGGELCQPGIVPGRFVEGVYLPNTASWLIGQVLKRIQRDRVSLWPPVFPEQPYHIRLVISYHDPAHHLGTIYKATNALPMYKNEQQQPIPGSSGKYGWCWKLPKPDWGWWQIPILQPRTMRLPL